MKRVEIEMLSEAVNCPVVRVPGRQFPGVVIQGDSLKILLDNATEIQEQAAPHKDEDLNAGVAHLISILSGYVREYEATMKAQGRELPYPKSG